VFYMFWLHHALSTLPRQPQPPRPVLPLIHPRTEKQEEEPFEFFTPTSSPTSARIPASSSSPAPSRPPNVDSVLFKSWRDIPWEEYPVIEDYHDMKPKVEKFSDFCDHNLPNCDRIRQYASLNYPAYHVPLPNFINDAERNMWINAYAKTFPLQVEATRRCELDGVPLCLKSPELTSPEKGIVYAGQVETTGILLSLRDGSAPANYYAHCGNMHRHWDQLLQQSFQPEQPEALVIQVPESWSFQHFLDGSFPKFIQWLDFIGPETLLVVEPSAKRFLCDLPAEQNLPAYCKIGHQITSAQLLHYGCLAPTMHPYQWLRMRSFVGVREIPMSARNVILYATRAGGQVKNRGQRVVVNDEQVQELLIQHFKSRMEEVVIYRSDEYSPMENLRLWNAARAVIGPHGGALYNSFFCLPETVMVEFMDFPHDDRIVEGHLVPYKAANFLGHKYYSLPIVTRSSFRVPLDQLQAILDREFPLSA